MAVRKSKSLPEVKVGVPKWHQEEMGEGQLDPGEEKILDWVLKGVIAFILGWLGLSILLVIGGYFHLWG
ncbi:hypothetical protein A3H89_00345 [Candidatus Amesbacteria bacterium RIFCSPLOWO2_02_FULL_48_11]|uniref:Uncharacterized protein n=4 Tax=Candidatus Amesiibacteriota TaxID=1752730 RepID=A0A1F4ZAF7_9BACT|nr:MAG: hypothetical protein UX78_C0005G0067 [Candidatus Amesbacteria bacterium GW2011_GWA2_47_11]KKU93755.1 MAG: hypothetical protein UY22_C0017G0012 [Candidatus Amesbacteria bacterium GW2011_GWC1_48_10]KKU99549.1 MAG: hypothetical protein UY33_C0028G0003 [Candidatus Amesbacteria bacterium GW2011_GWA1_48_9]OGC90001.1 MAG: hypothetical protein A2V48_01170 [Candidatus Amesbacteria bacterium RBG_19FT_COMBO_48_16]OGC96208.1 MAG: hypothetical protein A3C34_02380 [Candidatus Amesbacteria bacterium R